MVVALFIVGVGVLSWKSTTKEPSLILITTFQECVAAGNRVMESYPRQCRSGEQLFTEDIGNELAKKDLIRLNAPRPNQVVTSPLIITGEARGSWFFEASFPIVLNNWDGLMIAQGIAQAKSDWMTTEFVPFEATLTFTVDNNASSNSGTLILRKDNPSGLPQNDDALTVPVLIGVGDQKGSAGIVPFKSGVRGRVTLGPTCPVMREPPDPGCVDKPYQTKVQVFAKQSASVFPFSTVETNSSGAYTVALPPGDYTLKPVSGSPFPSCETKDVTIAPDVMSNLDLTCDSGIR